MPPKAKTESTELQVFNLENLNPALLPELATFKEIQLQVVAENPFVAIVDTTTRELAKKYRTALKTARTDLEKQDKLISSKFNEAKTKAKSYIAELIDYTLPGELEQQKEIVRDEAVLEEKRQEKARIEQQRVDNIKKEIEDYYSTWNNAITNLKFEYIKTVSGDFLESYTSFDTAILEEFETLFPAKVEELNRLLSSKTELLNEAENARVEKLRLEEEAKLIAIQKAELAAQQKIADEAEAKAKKEREDFEKEKLAFQLEVAKKLELEKAELEAKKLAEEKTLEVSYSTSKTTQPITPEIIEILEANLPTVNVCTSEEIKNFTVIDAEIVSKKPTETTWDDIASEFKSSGHKSYSVWLKSNYNVPTKL